MACSGLLFRVYPKRVQALFRLSGAYTILKKNIEN
jgi:hypothetical protein